MKLLRTRLAVLTAALAAAIGITFPLLSFSTSSTATSSPALTSVVSVVGDGGATYCALLGSSGVDCWGYGADGELGNGASYSSSPNASDTPVPVVGVGGTGTLSGVASLVGGDNDPGVSTRSSFCALLTSGGVDCWGYGPDGELGNGASSNSAAPVQVEGVGGTGTLSGVTSLTSSPGSYCAELTSGGVDCWGHGADGELGNAATSNSATPVQVTGLGGSGLLSGVASVTGSGVVEGYPNSSEQPGYCALLSSGGADCWGSGADGQLGNGVSSNSATPVQVQAVGGGGTLSGLSSITGDGFGYCGLLTSHAVDCWGYGSDGELGNGISASSSTPVQVRGVGGSGTLSGVSSLTGDVLGYCALLQGSGGVDCWGYGGYAELGNGASSSSSTPVQVQGVGGVGTLSGVSSVAGEGLSYCASGSGKAICWGYGSDGELGNGVSSSSSSPVVVEAVGGSGSLSQVASVTGNYLGSYCAVLTFGGVDCWGDNSVGELGNSAFSSSSTPVQVVAAVTLSSSVVLPSNGATVSGTQNLDAVPSAGATGVQFELTGGTLSDDVIATATLTDVGWAAAWNSVNVPNGTYTLQSIATFGGPSIASPGITITVNNPAPTTTVVVPSNNATLSGTQNLAATASSGVVQVQFEVTGGIENDDVIATATLSNGQWSAAWNSLTVPNGTYTLQSVASSPGGVMGTSPGITVTVNNPAPTTTVVLPSNNATLSGTQNLDATASSGVVQVQYELTGGALNGYVIATATPTYVGWAASWNTTGVPDGTYTLQSFASYFGGVTGTSPGVTVTINN